MLHFKTYICYSGNIQINVQFIICRTKFIFCMGRFSRQVLKFGNIFQNILSVKDFQNFEIEIQWSEETYEKKLLTDLDSIGMHNGLCIACVS
jgi:hypothetical protein